ncbi:MAG: leucyl aminopeptidase [Planctomycetota bacterium]|jgi:leucyl aminopeptidase
MLIAVTKESIATLDADTMVLSLFEDRRNLTGAAHEMDRALGGMISSLLEENPRIGRLNESLVLRPSTDLPMKQVILVGLGKIEELSIERCRQAGGKAAKEAYQAGAQVLALAIEDEAAKLLTPSDAAQAAAEGILMGSYICKNHKTSPPDLAPVQKAFILASSAEDQVHFEQGLQRGEIFADAACAARDLVNQPSNYMTPSLLAEVARAVALNEGLAIEVLNADHMEDLGMGALLGVAQGSGEAPQFIIVEHKARISRDEVIDPKERTPTVVLVGKGITFDSGGISLKSRDHMEEMKTDMAGAAAVISVMQGVARLGLPIKVVALVPACENLPSGTAVRPGDVLTAMNGKTIEVVNTDAEGRLILADALCFASRYMPDMVIDVATLTSACVTALGEEVAAGIFSNNDELCAELIAAGEVQGEKLWRLPLFDEYKERIVSDVADMKNTGGRYGGVGSSAQFLMEFTSYSWAHMDIAGMAMAKRNRPYIPKGATGFGVRTLLEYLMKFNKA